METNERFLILDLFRCVAAFGVLIFHIIYKSNSGYSFVDGLYVLVDFFFVLSGFVLLTTFPQNKKGLLKDYRKFVFLRGLRLMPIPMIAIFLSLLPYWLGRLVTGRSDIFVFENSNKSLDDVISGMLLLQIVFSTSIFLVIPLWSLSAEWITNLITALFGPLKSNSPILLLICFGYLALFYGMANDKEWIAMIGATRGWEALGRAIIGFSIGMLIRKNYKYLKNFTGRFSLTLALVLFAIANTTWFYVGFSNLYFISIVFGVVVLHLSSMKISKTSKLGRISKSVGHYSFGLYVFHMVFLMWFNYWDSSPGFGEGDVNWIRYFVIKTMVVGGLSLIATHLSIKYVEGPIRKFGAFLIDQDDNARKLG